MHFLISEDDSEVTGQVGVSAPKAEFRSNCRAVQMSSRNNMNWLLIVVGFGWLLPSNLAIGDVALQFNRDIRPLLSDRCFQCHGPDEKQRESGLRLDERGAALLPAESGALAIVPGDSDASELVRRILADDPDEVMPPPEIGKPLSAAEKELLRKWVAEGAIYQQHWSFTPPKRSAIPEVQARSWPRNPIDYFVLDRLERKGLGPSPAADWTTLFRRVSLDLTGLPPTPDDVATFVAEMTAAKTKIDEDRVYAKWIGRLFESRHYGERMAVDWLDAARFADSNGYQVDRDREMYAWRDWVINAFNSNMPFDQFTVEQLAGDLLPKPTLQQRIATGFHRNHMMNEEGGIIPAEFLAEYCCDRVETTATVWLGQTFNCCRCHDHKFDPFTQTDYYGLYAFFHNITEQGVGNYGANIRRNAPPMLKLPAPELEAKLQTLNEQLRDANEKLANTEAGLVAEQLEWERRLRASKIQWSPAKLVSASIGESDTALDDGQRATLSVPTLESGEHLLEVVATLPKTGVTSLRIECIAPQDDSAFTSSFKLLRLRVFPESTESANGEPLAIRAAAWKQSLSAAELSKALDDINKTKTAVTVNANAPTVLVVALDRLPAAESTTFRLELSLELDKATSPWELRVFGTEAEAELLIPDEIHRLVHADTDARTDKDAQRIASFFQEFHSERRRLKGRVDTLTKEIDAVDLQIPTTLVMEEMSSPRKTFILVRGAYDNPGAAVTPAPPAVLPPMAASLPRNRLGLAQWLVDPANPLPARVTVNRFWQSLFGTGLVRTAEDFGAQGEPSSHPELLDWLAVEFVESGWDVKAILRLIVTSSTYRQSSRQTLVLRQRDPMNRLLTRGPRFRLQAEFVRDQALAASGLLVATIGGPSVRPYHPPGLYEQVVAGSGASTYVLGEGDELYRRSLYTYWKRSVPNPAMLLFDAPFRERCTTRRSRTNTPLQALNLMNDPTYVEAARFLAHRMIREGGEAAASRIARGYQLLLGRSPNAAEAKVLLAAYARTHADFSDDVASAKELLNVGETPAEEGLDIAELAAMTTVASTLLNLDETVTKE